MHIGCRHSLRSKGQDHEIQYKEHIEIFQSGDILVTRTFGDKVPCFNMDSFTIFSVAPPLVSMFASHSVARIRFREQIYFTRKQNGLSYICYREFRFN
jgi:flavin reductase (DIM6/NTAB) family NADH-FMN oxidoreductase RutF